MNKRVNLKNIIIGFVISLFVLIADQFTKYLIASNYPQVQRNIFTIIKDFLYISHTENTGAAWSLFEGQTFILIVIPVIVLIFAIVFLTWTNRMVLTVPIAMAIGGGLGNLIDRIVRGKVVDFIDVYIFGYDFPVFNVADISLVCGMIFLAIYILFFYKEEKPGFKLPFKIGKKEKTDKEECDE